MSKFILIFPIILLISCNLKNESNFNTDININKQINFFEVVYKKDTLKGYITISNDSIFFSKRYGVCQKKPYLLFILNEDINSFTIEPNDCEENLLAFQTKIYSKYLNKEIRHDTTFYYYSHTTNSIIVDNPFNVLKHKTRWFVFNEYGDIVDFSSNYIKDYNENLPFFYNE